MAQFKTPENLLYSKEHEWAEFLDDGTVRVGITDYAQYSLKDVTYLELPEKGDTVTAGIPMGSIESVKAASDIYAPVSGEVIEVNEELLDEPERVNDDPYDSWMVIIKPTNLEDDKKKLLDAEAYNKYVAELEGE